MQNYIWEKSLYLSLISYEYTLKDKRKTMKETINKEYL